MKNITKFFKHLKTIRRHRKYVKSACLKMGIPIQGLLHDLSKYSWTELKIYKYYTGTKSPHDICRELTGSSPSWIHHYQHNKHHYQHYFDTGLADNIVPIKIPYKYIIEMFCDRVGACHAYQGKNFTKEGAWDYYMSKDAGHRIMECHSEYLLQKLLWNLHEMGEERFFAWYKLAKNYLKTKYDSNELEY